MRRKTQSAEKKAGRIKTLENSISGLEILGMAAGILLIASAVGMFLSGAAAASFMAAAVGCGVVMNMALAILAFIRKQSARGIVFQTLSLMLAAIFIMQMLG